MDQSPFKPSKRRFCDHFSLFALILGVITSPGAFAQDTPSAQAPAAEETIATEPGANPVMDSSLDATGTTNALFEKLKGSGKTGIALFLISVFGFSFAFERLFNLRRSRITPDGLAPRAEKLWQAEDIAGLKKLALENQSALGRVIIEIIEHRDAPRADISTMAGDVGGREMRYHLQRAYPLAVVATISPLLGLFGTVYGMIGAFESVALAGEMGDPSIMAGDISYALITTAIGLVIAVPALAFYHFFRIRTQMMGLELEEQLSHLINRWFPTGTRKKPGDGEES